MHVVTQRNVYTDLLELSGRLLPTPALYKQSLGPEQRTAVPLNTKLPKNALLLNVSIKRQYEIETV